MERKTGYIRAYSAFWKYGSDFRGRISKEAFWKAWCIHNLISCVLVVIALCGYMRAEEGIRTNVSAWLAPYLIYGVVTIVPAIALTIRRLHDTGRDGLWFFLYLVPFAGLIVFFIMLVRPSVPYDVYPGMSGLRQHTQEQGRYVNGYYYPSRPLPPARRFAPPAGGNSAVLALVSSVILAAAGIFFNFGLAAYMLSTEAAAPETGYYDQYDGGYYDPYEYGDPYGEYGDPYSDPYSDEYDDYYDYYDSENFLTEEEQTIVDSVREGVLEGFPEYTIEAVLLSRVDDMGLVWVCEENEGAEGSKYYVEASGYQEGTFFLVYAGFYVSESGGIELFNLDDGENRDEFGEGAAALYEEWYKTILAGGNNLTLSAFIW